MLAWSHNVVRNPLVYACVLGCAELIAIVLYARSIYPAFPVLGWDSIGYVAQVYVNQHFGPIVLIQSLHYPYLYVQALTLVAFLVGSPYVAEAAFPPVLACLLILVYTRVASHLGLKHAALLVVPLSAGLSVNLLFIEADLSRTLLSLVLSWCILDLVAVRGRMIGRRFPELLVISLSIFAAYTEIETWILVFLAIALYTIISRNWRLFAENLLVGVGLLGALALVYPSYFLTYPAAAAAFGAPPTGWTAALDFGLGGLVLAPLAILGIGHLIRRNVRDAVARRTQLLVLSWVGSCGALFVLLPYLLPGLPALRALYLVPIPLLLGCAMHELWHAGRGPSVPSASSPPLKPRFRRLARLGQDRRITIPVAILAVACIAGGSYFVLLQYPPTNPMQPFISIQEYDQLQNAGKFLNSKGISAVLVPSLGTRAMYFWGLYQGYLQAELPNPAVIYGPARYVLSGVNPGLYEQFPYYSDYQRDNSNSSYQIAQQTLSRAHATIDQLPVLFLTPDIYDPSGLGAVPNLSSFEVSPGFYYVPPGQLDLSWSTPWTFNWTNVLSSTGSSSQPFPGSVSAEVLTSYDLSAGASAKISFSFFNLNPVNATLQIRIYNYPSHDAGDPTTFAPVNVSVDGQAVAEYSYTGMPPPTFVWLTIPLAVESAGTHTLTIQSGEAGHPVALTLDTATLTWG
jgi:hypothetical protein